MYSGVYFGAQRGFVFCRGRTNSQFWYGRVPLESHFSGLILRDTARLSQRYPPPLARVHAKGSYSAKGRVSAF